MSKIIIFENMRAFLKGDKACKAANLQVDIMPVPEYLSSECGMCFVVGDELLSRFRPIMAANKLIIVQHEKR